MLLLVSYEPFAHVLQGYLIGNGAIAWLSNASGVAVKPHQHFIKRKTCVVVVIRLCEL